MDINLKSKRAWETILLDIVETEKFDPEDVDTRELLHCYKERLEGFQEQGKEIPEHLIKAGNRLLSIVREK